MTGLSFAFALEPGDSSPVTVLGLAQMGKQQWLGLSRLHRAVIRAHLITALENLAEAEQ